MMTKRELGSLAFVLAGIYALVEALNNLFAVGFLLSPELQKQLLPLNVSWPAVAAIGIVPTVLLFGLGGALIGYSGRLATWKLGDPAAPAAATISIADLRAMLLAVIGTAMIAAALPHFARFATAFALSDARGDSVQEFAREIAGELAQSGAMILVGAALILGQRGAMNAWVRVRRGWHTLRGQDAEGSPRE